MIRHNFEKSNKKTNHEIVWSRNKMRRNTYKIRNDKGQTVKQKKF